MVHQDIDMIHHNLNNYHDENWFNVDIKTITLIDSLSYMVSALIIGYLYKLIKRLWEPMNYKLDMTTKEYCKNLAEVDNRYMTRQQEFDNDINLHRSSSSSGSTQANLKEGDQKKARYLLDPDKTRNQNVNLLNGWIPVLESSKVQPGTVRRAMIFGKDLIVTRSKDGQQVNILDAYCPHAGVHIGIGGSVREVDNESCVQCPFHGWSFRSSDGQCVDIPYQTKKCIPSQARLSSWPCLEVDNFIYLWHHLDNLPPNWSMDPTPELLNGNWKLGARSVHVSHMELEYMHENGADLNHFAGIHQDLVVFGNIENLPAKKYVQKYIKHVWEPSWKPIVDKLGRPTHKAQLCLKSQLSIFGFKIIEFCLVATQIGPARVKLLYDSRWFGRGMLSMNCIPLAGRRLKYIQHLYTGSSFLERIQAKVVLYAEVKMLERDLAIWNHKKYLKNPIVVPEDKTNKQFRLWYSQFYRKKIRISGDLANQNDDKGSISWDDNQNEISLPKLEF